MSRYVRLVLACGFAAALAGAEARLEVPASFPPGITVSARLVVTDGAAIASYAVPEIAGLELEPQDGFRSFTRVNERTEHALAVALRAQRTGRFEIPAVTVRLGDGTELRTAPVVVQVAPGDQRLVGVAVASAAFEPAEVLPGEPTALVYRLWMRADARPQGTSIAPPPEGMRLDREPREQVTAAWGADGSEWKAFTVTWRLTFTEPGEHVVSGQQRVLVRGSQFREAAQELAVAPARLVVRALPAAGRPPDFGGLVGEVHADAKLDRERIAAGEGARLTLRVRGALGAAVPTPTLRLPEGLRAYPQPPVDAGPARVLAWDLVPLAPGTYRIAVPTLPYFDPTARGYRRTAADELTLTVLPGRASTLDVHGPAVAAAPEADVAAAMPMPARHRLPEPAPTAPWWALAGSLLAALALRATGSLRPRRATPRHARDAVAALGAGDTDRAASALAAMLPDLPPGPARVEVERLLGDIDAARFGGVPLPSDAVERARALEVR